VRVWLASLVIAFALGTYLLDRAAEISERAAAAWLGSLVPFARPTRTRNSERQAIDNAGLLQPRASTPETTIHNLPRWGGVLPVQYERKHL
jgi:hypothetical protein